MVFISTYLNFYLSLNRFQYMFLEFMFAIKLIDTNLCTLNETKPRKFLLVGFAGLGLLFETVYRILSVFEDN